MKKYLLRATVLLCFLFSGTQGLYAQSTFTADLELIFRDTTRYFVLEPYDSVQVGFSVVNHGPDNVDTNGLVLYGLTGLPPGFALVVQSDSGTLMMINHNDTVNTKGIRFSQAGDFERDTTINYCYYLMVNEDPDSFIYDPNPLNDTLCFSILYKKNDSLTSIASRKAETRPLQIVPNPATDRVRIPVMDFKHQSAIIKIYSMDGRLVHTAQLVSGGADPVQLDVRAWNKGMYLVEIQSDTKKRRGRFIVQ